MYNVKAVKLMLIRNPTFIQFQKKYHKLDKLNCAS